MTEGLECSTIVSADDLVVLLGIEIERLKEREHHNCATILHLRDYVKKENSDLKELRARVAELEAALAWYADRKNYLLGAPGEKMILFNCGWGDDDWVNDYGSRARKALKGGEE